MNSYIDTKFHVENKDGIGRVLCGSGEWDGASQSVCVCF